MGGRKGMLKNALRFVLQETAATPDCGFTVKLGRKTGPISTFSPTSKSETGSDVGRAGHAESVVLARMASRSRDAVRWGGDRHRFIGRPWFD